MEMTQLSIFTIIMYPHLHSRHINGKRFSAWYMKSFPISLPYAIGVQTGRKMVFSK